MVHGKGLSLNEFLGTEDGPVCLAIRALFVGSSHPQGHLGLRGGSFVSLDAALEVVSRDPLELATGQSHVDGVLVAHLHEMDALNVAVVGGEFRLPLLGLPGLQECLADVNGVDSPVVFVHVGAGGRLDGEVKAHPRHRLHPFGGVFPLSLEAQLVELQHPESKLVKNGGSFVCHVATVGAVARHSTIVAKMDY